MIVNGEVSLQNGQLALFQPVHSVHHVMMTSSRAKQVSKLVYNTGTEILHSRLVAPCFSCPRSLSGTLPKAIAAANFLTQLRLGSNKLAGTVPLAINTLSHLAELDLSDNPALTGTLPSMK
jgi:hypothetical protein